MFTFIIVVYKSDPEKLEYIINNIQKKYKIIIIDNSKNYNFNKFKNKKNLKIIRSENNGNGAGINIGLKKCKTKYAVYVDIDVIFKKKFFEKFLQLAIKLKDKFAVLTPNAINYKSNKKLLEIYEFEAPVMLFDTKILKKINFFDEKFFLYFEELDLFLRCKKNKFKVYIATQLKITHNRSTSINLKRKSINKLKCLRQWHYMWSMFYFYRKHNSYLYGFNKTIVFLIKDLIMVLICIIRFDFLGLNLRISRISGLLNSYLLLKSGKRL